LRPATKQAFSLAELLVYQALLLLLIGMAAMFLVPGLRLQSRGLEQAERLRCSHLIMDQLCRDLRQTPPACLSLQSGILSGRRLNGWTPDGTVLLADEGWFFDVQKCRRAQAVLNLAPTWREALPLAQYLPHLRWQKLSPEPALLTFSGAGSDPARPRPPYSLQLQIGDLSLQQTVQARLAR